MATAKVKPPLKFHGGKHNLADRILQLLPPCTTYLEPFAGGLSVLLARDPTDSSEVVNDISGDLTTFWRVLQNEDDFAKFLRLCEATPFSESEWETTKERLSDKFLSLEDHVQTAWAFFVRCRQSLAGRMKSFAPVSTSRLRRGQNEQVSAWLTAIEGLPAVHARLKRVLILNRDACDVLRQFDKPGVVSYVDPPYFPTTRASADVYAHEMSATDHERLLDTLLSLKEAKAVVSGYRCELYDDRLAGWRRTDFEIANHAAGGQSKRRMVESVWSSPNCEEAK